MVTRKFKLAYVAHICISMGQWLAPGKDREHSKLTLYFALSSNNVGIKEKSFNSHNFH